MANIDAEIIGRLQNDDRKAFDTLYGQYSQKIFLNALRLTKDREVAEDIVQDVFITLWEKRLSIDPSRPILNWIFVISYRKSLDYLKKALKTALFSEIDFSDGRSRHTDKEDPSIKEQRLNLIEAATRQLSPQKRRVFEICKLRGQTYEYAAREMQISKHTVKEYLSEAMKNVKAYIQAAKYREVEMPNRRFI